MAPLVLTIMQGPLCGTLTTMLLYGMICMQTFFYFQNYPDDRRGIKVLVGCIWILETAHTALSIHFIEFYLIMNFSDSTTLEYAVWSMPATYFIGFFIAYAVNLCFIWRIWLLSKKRWIGICLVILATIRLGFGLGNCSLSFRYSAWKEFRAHVFPTMVTGWVISAVVDTLIASSLCYYLHKRRTGMKRTDSIINRLLLYSINTGAITSFFAILVIIMFLGLPTTLAFIGFVQVQSKFYAVSLFATLNTRKSTVESANKAVRTADNIPLSFTSHGHSTSKGSYPRPPLPPIEIHQSTWTDVHSDQETQKTATEGGGIFGDV
ncbi:hypothetical protein BJ138DRAFT_1093049 [Hygrophoropsis aurantiaca]|uniref:Uncharacterized protein n=1 Tax=Hygrophoropsis aurantiaca TaxID=72124 RepID=A0ACB8A1R2_9AGAM|nr:hypothetical protein BJ138DRAFT_1093049 [Hygrophoropsis aurantiaca]